MNKKFFNGIQSLFVNELINEGIDNALNKMVNEAGTNALMLFINHDDFSASGMNIKLTHTKREDTQIGGFFCDIDPKYYKNTKIKPKKTKTPELKDRDAIGEIARAAKEKGLEVYLLIINNIGDEEYDKYEDLHMRAINGQKVPAVLCHNQPEVRKFYKALIDNLHDKYGSFIDGFCLALLDHYSLFGFTTLTDELSDTVGIKKFEDPRMGLSCFCNTCVEQAKKKGINVEKVKKGLLKGIELGYIPEKIERMFSTDAVLRFLLDIPEFLEWLRFRSSVHTEVHKDLYEYIKEKNSNYKVGLDIYGAKDDWKYQIRFQEVAKYCDWIKPMFYSSIYEEALGPKDVGEGVKLAKSLSDALIYAGIYAGPSEPRGKIEESIDYAIKNGADGIMLSWGYAIIPYEYMNVVKNKLKKFSVI